MSTYDDGGGKNLGPFYVLYGKSKLGIFFYKTIAICRGR